MTTKQQKHAATTVLLVKTSDSLIMSMDYDGGVMQTECETVKQGLQELSEATGVPVADMYVTRDE